MNHHHIFFILLLCGGIFVTLLTGFIESPLINFLTIINFFIIFSSYGIYYKKSRPKSTKINNLTLSIWITLLYISLTNFYFYEVYILYIIFQGLLLGMLGYVLLEKQLLSKKDRILTKVKKGNLYILLIGLFVSALVAPKFIHMLQDNQQVSAAQNSINIPNLIDSAQPISGSIDQSLQFFTYFDENEIVTYGSFLPLLREKFDGEFRSQNIEFSYIPTESVLYPSFKYAIDKGMVGAGVDPNWSVKCQNLMVLLGLAQSRDVDSSPEGLLDSFREEAAKRGLMRGGCDTKDQVVLGSMLP